MWRYRRLLAGGLLLFASAAAGKPLTAQVDALVARMTREEARQTAQLLGMCGGVYAAFSAFTAPQAPERSREYGSMGNGALTAGAYLLYREHRRRAGEIRPVAEFMPPVSAQAEAAATETLAAFGRQDFDTAQEKLADCLKMTEMQDFLLAAMQEELGRR